MAWRAGCDPAADPGGVAGLARGARVGAGEQSVLAGQGERKDGALDEVVVTFYGDFKRFTGLLDVVSLDELAGEIICLDCNGSGDVAQFMPEPARGPVTCVTCKGTGHVLVSL